jgi:hypothetical protein
MNYGDGYAGIWEAFEDTFWRLKLDDVVEVLDDGWKFRPCLEIIRVNMPDYKLKKLCNLIIDRGCGYWLFGEVNKWRSDNFKIYESLS